MARFKLASEADSSWRELSLDDLEFSVGNQWPLNIKTQRESKNKPCLVMDQIQQSVRLTCNEYRQQRPSINVSPVGSESDVDTAEILQGSARHVEVNSDAEIAYDGAHESVVRCGTGSWRILSDYADDETDEQEIFIKPIRNRFSVYWQPGVPHEDADWAFIISDPPIDTYKDDYADSELAKVDFNGIGNSAPEWITKEYVRVAEYFTREKIPGKRRKAVKWRKINAIEILDGGEEGKKLPGTSIPIFTAYGDDLDVDGKRYVAGLVRNAKGPQRMYNFFCSKAAETVTKAVASPVMAVAGSIAGYEGQWERASTGDVAVLPYNPVDIQGKPAPPPQILQAEPPIQAMSHMIQQAAMDLRAATGLYDPSLGQRKGDESGKAIERLQSQGDVATFNYSDNMAREMRRSGKVLIDWIRAIYDTPRVQRIIKPDGSTSQVVIHNGPDQKDAANKLLTEKIKKIYDIGVGRYDVVVEVGPSYKTKRQEAVATQLDFLKMMPPQIGQNFLDLITANMDWPQAQEFAKRAKKMLPPQLQDDDGTDPEVKLNQMQGQMQQMAQQHELLTKALQEAHQVITTKQIEQDGKMQIEQLKTQADKDITKMKIEAQVTMAEITTKAQDAMERARMYTDIWNELHGSAHERGMQAQEHAHAQDLAGQQAAQAQQSQAADQAHQQQMAEQAQEQQVGAE